MVFGRLVDELQSGMTVDAQDWEGLSETDILNHWTKNVSNLDVELPENCASFVSLFFRNKLDILQIVLRRKEGHEGQ